VLPFIETMRGDEILSPDSMIIEPGGPGFMMATDIQEDSGVSGSGNSGCFIDTLRY